MILYQFNCSPLQQGMLYHCAKNEHSGVDIEQLVIDYDENIDADVLARAWKIASERYAALRTSFSWEGLSSPVQQVHDNVTIPFESQVALDDTSFEAFLREDRRRGFNLARPPLTRLTFFVSEERSSRLVWTLHHILMDGRSFILVLNEVDGRTVSCLAVLE